MRLKGVTKGTDGTWIATVVEAAIPVTVPPDPKEFRKAALVAAHYVQEMFSPVEVLEWEINEKEQSAEIEFFWKDEVPGVPKSTLKTRRGGSKDDEDSPTSTSFDYPEVEGLKLTLVRCSSGMICVSVSDPENRNDHVVGFTKDGVVLHNGIVRHKGLPLGKDGRIKMKDPAPGEETPAIRLNEKTYVRLMAIAGGGVRLVACTENGERVRCPNLLIITSEGHVSPHQGINDGIGLDLTEEEHEMFTVREGGEKMLFPEGGEK